MPEAPQASATAEQLAREVHGAVIVRAGQLVSASQQWQADGNLPEIERVADGLQLLREGGVVHAAVKTLEEYFDRLLHRLWFSVGRPNRLAKTEAAYCKRFPSPNPWKTHLHRHHTLYLPVEPKVTISKLCAGFKIAYGGGEDTLEPWDVSQELPQWNEPHWMWCQPGPWFFNWEPREVRAEGLAPKEWPCSAGEGIHIWGLTGPYPYVTYCPRSVLRGRREECTYLRLIGIPELNWGCDWGTDPKFGAGSRGE